MRLERLERIRTARWREPAPGHDQRAHHPPVSADQAHEQPRPGWRAHRPAGDLLSTLARHL